MLNCERQIKDLHNRLYFLYITNMSQKIVFCCYTFCINFCSLLFFLFPFHFANLFNSTENSHKYVLLFLSIFYLSLCLVVILLVVWLLKINTIESGAGVLSKSGPVVVYCDGKPLDLLVDRFILEELDQVRIIIQAGLFQFFFAKLDFFFSLFCRNFYFHFFYHHVFSFDPMNS